MTFSDLLTVLVVGAASYRLTRLVTSDSISTSFRGWLWRKAYVDDGWDSLNDRQAIRRRPGFSGWAWDKLSELASCPFCLGVWVTAGVWCWWAWLPWFRPWIMLAAAMGVQALISSRRDA